LGWNDKERTLGCRGTRGTEKDSKGCGEKKFGY